MPNSKKKITQSISEHHFGGFDKTLTPGQLTPYKINGKMKIKKAQNYQCDPIQVHQ